MKFLSRHLVLRRLICIIVICAAVYSILFAISAYQKYVRDKNTYGNVVEKSDGIIPSYNVDGMSEEEIMKMLEEQRQGE